MIAKGLVDTGAIYALLDADDAWHERCIDAFASVPVPLATSAAVLTELFRLLGARPDRIDAAWRWLRSGAVVVSSIDDDDLPALEILMRRYADRPMDFADATLVHLAERKSLTTVLTVDHDDFETYRIGRRGRFRIVPPR